MEINDKYPSGTALCISGHRPEKFGFYPPDAAMLTKRLKSMLYLEMKDCLDGGYRTFIAGGSKGVDLWAAEIVIGWKNEGLPVSLITVLPYRSYGKSYTGLDIYHFNRTLENSDEVEYVGEEYTKSCMFRRNEFMVDCSSRLIAVVKDYKSGTGQTIRYAGRKGIDIRLIDINENAPLLSPLEGQYMITDGDFR